MINPFNLTRCICKKCNPDGNSPCATVLVKPYAYCSYCFENHREIKLLGGIFDAPVTEEVNSK